MLSKIKKLLRNNRFVWKYYLNFKVSIKYIFQPLTVQSLESKSLLNTLKKNGIAIGDAEKIIGANLFNNLLNEAIKLKEKNSAELSDKDYAKFYLDNKYDKDSIWARVAECEAIKFISQSYFEMRNPRLVYYDLWENFPSDDSPKNAQLWHRDRDDLQILKVFIYFTDVDEDTGAFVYAPGTHILGSVKKDPAYFLEDGKTPRSYDEDMEKIVPSDQWISGSGIKGTIVFADTHGYHKGGFVKNKFRFLYTCMYLSKYSGRIRFSNIKY